MADLKPNDLTNTLLHARLQELEQQKASAMHDEERAKIENDLQMLTVELNLLKEQQQTRERSETLTTQAHKFSEEVQAAKVKKEQIYQEQLAQVAEPATNIFTIAPKISALQASFSNKTKAEIYNTLHLELGERLISVEQNTAAQIASPVMKEMLYAADVDASATVTTVTVDNTPTLQNKPRPGSTDRSLNTDRNAQTALVTDHPARETETAPAVIDANSTPLENGLKLVPAAPKFTSQVSIAKTRNGKETVFTEIQAQQDVEVLEQMTINLAAILQSCSASQVYLQTDNKAAEHIVDILQQRFNFMLERSLAAQQTRNQEFAFLLYNIINKRTDLTHQQIAAPAF